MRRFAIIITISLHACAFDLSVTSGPPIDASGASDGSDAASDAPPIDPSLCFGTGFGRVCLAAVPTTPLTLATNLAFDTGGTACTETPMVGGDPMCVLAGTTVLLPTGVTFRGVGSRPLIIVAVDSVTIDGILSVSSLAGLASGAGAASAGCGAATAGLDDASGASGGAGGTFGGRGGVGGIGDTNDTPSAGGQPAQPFTPTTVRGGCPGTSGGTGDAAGGAGRSGGGALYLVARVRILVNGSIYAMGRGGGGAMSRGGGGGGGSGGLVGFDAPMTVINGGVGANGGGAGEGARVQAETGLDGEDGFLGFRARGGDDLDPLDGPGGDGSEGATTAGGTGGAAAGGGGGGGGGAGYVYVKGARTGAGGVSPAPTVVP